MSLAVVENQKLRTFGSDCNIDHWLVGWRHGHGFCCLHLKLYAGPHLPPLRQLATATFSAHQSRIMEHPAWGTVLQAATLMRNTVGDGPGPGWHSLQCSVWHTTTCRLCSVWYHYNMSAMLSMVPLQHVGYVQYGTLQHGTYMSAAVQHRSELWQIAGPTRTATHTLYEAHITHTA